MPRKGFKHSLESRLRMSQTHSGLKQSEEHIKNAAVARTGLKRSAETRKKLSLGKIGTKNPAWKGGMTLTSGGYRKIRSKNSYAHEHRLVMESFLGKKLDAKNVVHHWNQDKTDNRISNLCLMRSAAAHARLHRFADRHGIEVNALKFSQEWLENVWEG